MAQTGGDRPSTDPPPATPSADAPQRAVFRMPFVAVVLLPILAAFCLGPVATVNAWWAVLFVIPILIGVAVVLTRTEVDGQAITVHGLRPKRRLAWTELDRLEFAGPRWAVAVSTDERRIRLPMVRPRDLPLLAAVSGGYLTFTAPPVPGSDTELPEDGVATTDAAGQDRGAAAAPSDDDRAREAPPTSGTVPVAPTASSTPATGPAPVDRPASPSGGGPA